MAQHVKPADHPNCPECRGETVEELPGAPECSLGCHFYIRSLGAWFDADVRGGPPLATRPPCAPEDVV